MLRRKLITASLALALLVPILGQAALAHHGWRWTDEGNFELTGVITAAKLGNPHGEVTVDADGESWTVEVGQPWRNERAGLTDDLLAPGVEATFSGQRHSDHSRLLMKAERVFIDGETYELYPDRD